MVFSWTVKSISAATMLDISAMAPNFANFATIFCIYISMFDVLNPLNIHSNMIKCDKIMLYNEF